MYYEQLLLKENHRFSIVRLAAAYPKAFKSKIDARELDAINVPDLCKEILESFNDDNWIMRYSFTKLSELFYGTLCIHRHKVSGLYWDVKDHKDFFQNIKNKIFVQVHEDIFKKIDKVFDDNDIWFTNTFEEVMEQRVLAKCNDAISIREFNLRDTKYFKETIISDDFEEMSYTERNDFFDLIEGRTDLSGLLNKYTFAEESQHIYSGNRSFISSDDVETVISHKSIKTLISNQCTQKECAEILTQLSILSTEFVTQDTERLQLITLDDIINDISDEVIIEKPCQNKIFRNKNGKFMNKFIEINNTKFCYQMLDFSDTMRCTTAFTDFRIEQHRLKMGVFPFTEPCHYQRAKAVSNVLKKFFHKKFSNTKKSLNLKKRTATKHKLNIIENKCHKEISRNCRKRLKQSDDFNDDQNINNENIIQFNISFKSNILNGSYKELCNPENVLTNMKHWWKKNVSPITISTLTSVIKHRTAAAVIFQSLLVLKKSEIIVLVKEENSLNIKYIIKGKEFK